MSKTRGCSLVGEDRPKQRASHDGTELGYEVRLLTYDVGPVGDPLGMRPGGGIIEAWDHMNPRYRWLQKIWARD